MADIKANGKVRLIAKNGRGSETAYTSRLRELKKNSAALGGGRVLSTETAEQAAERHKRNNDTAFNNLLQYGDGREDYLVEFEATPDITEQGSASYFEEGNIRGPGSIMMYMGSPSRSFSIAAKFISRTPEEAKETDRKIHILKSWRMPESYTGGFVQEPPSILYLQGYGKMFKDIQVVMTDLSIEFSSEYDYIQVGTGSTDINYEETTVSTIMEKNQPVTKVNTKDANMNIMSFVPIITTVSISLKEAHNVGAIFAGLMTFDILKYRTGELPNW